MVDWAVGRVVDFFGMPIGVVDNGVVDFGVVDSGVVNFGEIDESFGVIITWVLGLGFGVLGFGFWVLGFGEADPISAESAERLIFLPVNTDLIGVDEFCISVKYAGRRREDDDDDSRSHVFLSTAKKIAFLLQGTFHTLVRHGHSCRRMKCCRMGIFW